MHKEPSASVNASRSKSTGPRAQTRKAKRIGSTAPEERLLTIGEVARILHVSRSPIYWLIQRGDLPTLRNRRLLRFRLNDVQRCIKREPHDLEGVL